MLIIRKTIFNSMDSKFPLCTLMDVDYVLVYFKHISSVDEYLFCRYWCLKEAYVKAIGIGVAYGLDKVEFHHTGWGNISVKIDGETMTEWKFWLFELGKRHWVNP